ncbi:MAG: ornithine carbamoyltransferase [Candidatus Caldatribacteriota bacterium]|jgi:ornithine carbamoyltransferase|nr:ornithine carbamoyltransferase [Atribacterota bacterium]MDD4288316.1 ornithine carbamoyltransferase [Atribacterota bacterium]MDI9597205.1 ornithine carbamoyltransferase [Atribacterota bacterium]
MPVNLRNRNLITLKDFSKKEILFLLDLAIELKKAKYAGTERQRLKGKNIALIFEKDSTRTRCAFEVAAFDQGANITYLGPTGSQMGKKESMEDTARVLGRYYDGIEFRGFRQESVETLAKYSGGVIWNGLTDLYHPTQVLADLMTVMENVKKPLENTVLVYVGDGRNNMANSLLMASSIMGMEFRVVAPETLYPDKGLVKDADKRAEQSGARIKVTDNITTGVEGADAIYTDVWVSMGEESQMADRIKLLRDYQVNMDMINNTHNPDVIFMHCLPSFHDTNTAIGKEVFEKYGLESMEVTDEVFRSKHSVVFDEAENRLHTIKAVMVATLGS